MYPHVRQTTLQWSSLVGAPHTSHGPARAVGSVASTVFAFRDLSRRVPTSYPVMFSGDLNACLPPTRVDGTINNHPCSLRRGHDEDGGAPARLGPAGYPGAAVNGSSPRGRWLPPRAREARVCPGRISTPECVLEHPEAVEELHREFVDAGAEVLQALAFYASKEKLATTGHARQTRDLGIDYVGSCCGSIPVHVREMARALGKRSSDKAWRIDYSKLTSAFEYYEHGAASK